MINRISKQNIWILLANALPGAYRVVGVFAFTQFLTDSRGEQFSSQYFWLGFAGSITALPLAALCYSKVHRLSEVQIAVAITLSSIACTAAIAVMSQSGSVAFLVNIFLAMILLALFEVERTKLAVDGKFQKLSIALFCSCVLMIVVINVLDDFAGQEIVLFALPLFLPIAVGSLFSSKSRLPPFNWSNLAHSFLSFSASNCLSTGLMFLFPLVLIQEYGESSATSVARVFVLSSLFFLLPRTLCSKAVPKLRTGESELDDVRQLFVVIAFLSVSFFCLCLVISFIWFYEMLAFLALALGLLSTQFALPFSNVLMVGGHSKKLLYINLSFALLFVALSALVFIFFDQGPYRGAAICIAFVVSNLEKARLTSKRAKEYMEALK